MRKDVQADSEIVDVNSVFAWLRFDVIDNIVKARPYEKYEACKNVQDR